MVDHGKIKKAVRMLIEAIGDDPDRPGLKETPDRVARAYDEWFEGMEYTNEAIATMNMKLFEGEGGNNLVAVGNIPIFSFCEHHLALMYNMKVGVAYIPKDGVLGLSKIARIADLCGKRLQLQERLGEDIAECMEIATGADDIMVVIEGEHSCMTTRGISKPGTLTRTATLKGAFKTDSDLRSEAYRLLNM